MIELEQHQCPKCQVLFCEPQVLGWGQLFCPACRPAPRTRITYVTRNQMSDLPPSLGSGIWLTDRSEHE